MKKLLNLFSLIIFFSCCKKNKIVNNDYKVSNNVQKNKIIKDNSFKLNNENVMEFFFEYEKKLKKDYTLTLEILIFCYLKKQNFIELILFTLQKRTILITHNSTELLMIL